MSFVRKGVIPGINKCPALWLASLDPQRCAGAHRYLAGLLTSPMSCHAVLCDAPPCAPGPLPLAAPAPQPSREMVPVHRASISGTLPVGESPGHHLGSGRRGDWWRVPSVGCRAGMARCMPLWLQRAIQWGLPWRWFLPSQRGCWGEVYICRRKMQASGLNSSHPTLPITGELLAMAPFAAQGNTGVFWVWQLGLAKQPTTCPDKLWWMWHGSHGIDDTEVAAMHASSAPAGCTPQNHSLAD